MSDVKDMAPVATRAGDYHDELAHDHDDHDDHAHFTPEEELENSKFAMWLYIGSEVMIFSGLLVAYLIFRVWNPEVIELAKEHLSITLVSANTFLLLASSWAMVMGLREIQKGNNSGLVKWLSVTVVMGAIFVGLQVVEYIELAHNGIVLTVPEEEEVVQLVESGEIPHWLEEGIEQVNLVAVAGNVDMPEAGVTDGEAGVGASESTVGSDVQTAEDVALEDQETADTVAQGLGAYGLRFYVPTAFHGAHVVVGCLWGMWIINRGWRKQYTSKRYASVEVFGLYWHFVDVVWIVLFTFIYLI